jgi:novobiocin biosynthesis protein NovU/D-mycarose 3-C-methyltransferase
LKQVFDLGVQALANDFRKDGESRKGHYPLKVLFCPKCSLSQLSAVVDPATLYRDYKYVTSSSYTMLCHFNHMTDVLNEEQPIESIVEIGSNDGAFLNYIRNKLQCRTLGIDPAENLRPREHMAITDFFNSRTAAIALNLLGENISVILARHCVAHMDDLRGFVESLKVLAGRNTLIAIEIPYMRDTLKRVEFDQIYHEHLNFISLHSLETLLIGTPFHFHRVVHYAIHGGTVLVLIRHNDSGIEPTVSEYVREDKTTMDDWLAFKSKSAQKVEAMECAVRSRVQEGKLVCGFGASAKASVWIQACGFMRKDIAFVTDNSPLKPGCVMPGTDIPVVPQDDLMKRMPDYAVLFAWNFRDECIANQKPWMDAGGRFIIPTATGVEFA